MEKVFHDNNDGTLNVSVTYLPADYNPIVTKVMDNLVKNVTVSGFRKGKAPKDVAMRYVKSEDVYNGMINKLIDKDFATLLDGYENASDVANVQPSLSVSSDEKKNAYNLIYTFVFLPKAEVEKFSGLGIEVKAKSVTAKDVDEEIKKLATDAAELVPSSEGAEQGDHVIIDFTGYVDGKEFDGGSAKDYELTLGSHAFVPGFEEKLIGVKEGEKRTIELTFPKDYLASLASKDAKFSVSVKAVKKVVLPEVNDEFASSVPSYKVKTLEELKKEVKAKLTKNAKDTARNEKISKVFSEIEKKAKIVVSDKYLEVLSKQVEENTLGQVRQYGINLNEYLSVVGLTQKQFHENALTQAKAEATRFALVRAITKGASLEVSEDDLANAFGGKEKYESLIKAGKEQEKKNSNFSMNAYLDNMRNNLLEQKVNDYLFENN